jgi:hypothetical protein
MDPPAEKGELLRIRSALDLNPVSLGFHAPGVADEMLEPAGISQEHKAFTFVVKASHRVDPWQGEESGQCQPPHGIGELAHDAIGLVEQHQLRRIGQEVALGH